MDPIHIELSVFEKLQIVRTELEQRQEEKEKLEGLIKSLLFEIEQAKYLKSLDPAYQKIDTTEQEEKLESLNKRRAEIYSILEKLEKTYPELETQARGKKPGAGTQGGSGGLDKKFSSFDDFKKKFPNAL